MRSSIAPARPPPRPPSPASRTPPSPPRPQTPPGAPDVGPKPLAASTTAADMDLSTKGPSDVEMFTLTVRPGGGSHWHSHRGPVLVSVTQGTLTVYSADGASCTKHTYKPGQAVPQTPRLPPITPNQPTTPHVLPAPSIPPTVSH